MTADFARELVNGPYPLVREHPPQLARLPLPVSAPGAITR